MNSQEIEIAVLRKVLSEQVLERVKMEIEANLAVERSNALQGELDNLRKKPLSAVPDAP